MFFQFWIKQPRNDKSKNIGSRKELKENDTKP